MRLARPEIILNAQTRGLFGLIMLSCAFGLGSLAADGRLPVWARWSGPGLHRPQLLEQEARIKSRESGSMASFAFIQLIFNAAKLLQRSL